MSNAVEPKSTETTATRPGRGTIVARFTSGVAYDEPTLRALVRVSRRPQKDSFATRFEYTSNGSARSNQTSPNSAPPISITATYTASHSRTEPR